MWTLIRTLRASLVLLLITLQLTESENARTTANMLQSTGKLTQNSSGFDIIECDFPLVVTLSRVDLNSAAGPSVLAIVDCGTSCKVLDRYKDRLRVVSPANKTSGNLFTFNISRSEETSGVYTCFGVSSLEEVSPPPVTGVATSQGQVDDAHHATEAGAAAEDSNSAGLAALIVIPIIGIAVFIGLYCLYRHKQLKRLEENRADAEQPTCLGFVRTILASLHRCVDRCCGRTRHSDVAGSDQNGEAPRQSKVSQRSVRGQSEVSQDVKEEDEGCNAPDQPLLSPAASPPVDGHDDDDHEDKKWLPPSESSLPSPLRFECEGPGGGILPLSSALTSSSPSGDRQRRGDTPESSFPSHTFNASMLPSMLGKGDDDDVLELSSLRFPPKLRQPESGGGSDDDNVNKQGVSGFLEAGKDTGPTTGCKKEDFPDGSVSGYIPGEDQIPDNPEHDVEAERKDKQVSNIKQNKGDTLGNDEKGDQEVEKEGTEDEKGARVEVRWDLGPSRRRRGRAEEGGGRGQDDDDYNTASGQDDQSSGSDADGGSAAVDRDDDETPSLQRLPHTEASPAVVAPPASDKDAPPASDKDAPPASDKEKRQTVQRLSKRLQGISNRYAEDEGGF